MGRTAYASADRLRDARRLSRKHTVPVAAGSRAPAQAMFGKLRSPPPYRLDLAHHGAFHERHVARGQRRQAAGDALKRRAAELEGTCEERMKRARRELATKSPPLPPAEQDRRRAAAKARKQSRLHVRELAIASPELFLIRAPRHPTVADMNRFAEARLAAAAEQTPSRAWLIIICRTWGSNCIW